MIRKSLYYTPNSPYARIARVSARQSGLIDSIEEIEVVIREIGSGYFGITPLARVPMLKDGIAMLGDTREICSHFDEITGLLRWFPQEDHEARFLRHVVCGFLDGLAVWLREYYRPEGQNSEMVLKYEQYRAEQILCWLESRWKYEKQQDYTALVLACAVDIAIDRGLGKGWEEIAPGIVSWATIRAKEPAMLETAPLPA